MKKATCLVVCVILLSVVGYGQRPTLIKEKGRSVIQTLQEVYEPWLKDFSNVSAVLNESRWLGNRPGLSGKPFEQTSYMVRYLPNQEERLDPLPINGKMSPVIKEQKKKGLFATSSIFAEEMKKTLFELKSRPDDFQLVSQKVHSYNGEPGVLVDVYKYRVGLENSQLNISLYMLLLPKVVWKRTAHFGYQGEVWVEHDTWDIRYFSMNSSRDRKEWSKHYFDYMDSEVWLNTVKIGNERQLVPMKGITQVKIADAAEYGYILWEYSVFHKFSTDMKMVVE